MKIKIYQINLEKDSEGAAFSGLSSYLRRTGKDNPDGDIYDLVWDGDVRAEGLEDIYEIFNNNIPDDFDGRSMSVSDIVEIVDPMTYYVANDSGEDINPGFYYCDSIGFARIDFTPRNLICLKNTIKVVVVEPGKKPYAKKIKSGLSSLQSEVDGYIECVYPFDDPVALIVNDEGKINGMSPNRYLCDDRGEVYDIIAGTFLVAGIDDDDFCSLSDDLVEKYIDLFKCPECEIKNNRDIEESEDVCDNCLLNDMYAYIESLYNDEASYQCL